jgi:hypothetical protein
MARQMDGNSFSERPHTGGGAFPGSGRARFGQGAANALSMKWSALHDAAETVALLAGVEGKAMTQHVRAFPVTLRDARPATRELVEGGIADIAAVLEPGLSALIAAHARGTVPQAAAAALWDDFIAARDALMVLAASQIVPPTLRSA